MIGIWRFGSRGITENTRGRTWKRCGTRDGMTTRKTSVGYSWKDQRKNGGMTRNWTISGREEMGAYDTILRRTPDHEDLLTTTDSEVIYRLVGRWVGQGGKASLANTADANILEYILGKLVVRIAAKTRTFLVKVKEHRRESLNEGADDLVWCFRTMTGSRTNGKKTHGAGLFETQQDEGRQNLW